MKKMVTFLLILAIVIGGLVFINRQQSFADVISKEEMKKIHEITLKQMVADEQTRGVRIEDEKTQQQLLDAISAMKLKKVDNPSKKTLYELRTYPESTFGIAFLTSNYVWITKNEKSEYYKIVNDAAPVKAIEGAGFDWKLEEK